MAKKTETKMHFEEKETKRVDVWRYKKYICKVRKIDIFTGKNIIVLNTDEAKEHDIYSGYRTEVKLKDQSAIAIVDVSQELVKPGEVGMFRDIAADYGIKEGDKVEIVHMNRPASIEYIKR